MEALAQGIMDKYNKQVQKNQKLLAENERLVNEIKQMRRERRSGVGASASSSVRAPTPAPAPQSQAPEQSTPMSPPKAPPRKHVGFKKTVEVLN